MTDRWYALCVCGGRELSIAEDLRDDGHTVLMPTQTLTRRGKNHRGKTVERKTLRPLVPSYVFCAVPFVTHDKVWNVVRVGGEPYPIPHAQFARLIALHETEIVEGGPRALSIGEVVRLTGGLYDGLPMTVMGEAGGTVEVETPRLLGKAQRLKVARDRIAA